ncbi:hypothetical protein SYYSPA8_34565 [Streptomyces yaizuensis]|uniref:Uncharacterized protein n=1 Tax=Streptomyces yaizuensis TaxID=2989713 RepID=A0ABQ5PAE5_9ACTN|nr:hypothetical protein SYYSPA8_34565 [Streptomyces sp. YSPA8]
MTPGTQDGLLFGIYPGGVAGEDCCAITVTPC